MQRLKRSFTAHSPSVLSEYSNTFNLDGRASGQSRRLNRRACWVRLRKVARHEFIDFGKVAKIGQVNVDLYKVGVAGTGGFGHCL
jgi:hypothetical protein